MATFKTIIQVLEDIFDEHTRTESFIYGTKGMQNLDADEAKLPTCFADYPIQSTGELQTAGGIQRTYKIILSFLYRAELDWSSKKHQNVIAKANEDADEFITRAQDEDDYIMKIDKEKRTDVINLFNVNISGTILECEITLKATNKTCYD